MRLGLILCLLLTIGKYLYIYSIFIYTYKIIMPTCVFTS